MKNSLHRLKGLYTLRRLTAARVPHTAGTLCSKPKLLCIK